MAALPLVYLDVCCLNRPFDDQEQDRIRIESEAVRLILKHHRLGALRVVTSAAIVEEINRTPDTDRRAEVLSLIQGIAPIEIPLARLKERSSMLRSLGFSLFDSLHLASAEISRAKVFLSTDDGLLKRARRNPRRLTIAVDNPAVFVHTLLGL